MNVEIKRNTQHTHCWDLIVNGTVEMEAESYGAVNAVQIQLLRSSRREVTEAEEVAEVIRSRHQ